MAKSKRDKLIIKLQECSTMGQADPVLTKLDAGTAIKKLVETAIVLNNSQDPVQRTHAFGFMESAIKQLETDDSDNDIKEESPMGQHSHEDGLSSPKIGAEGGSNDGTTTTVSEEEEKDDKDKDKENPIHEEELSNHNQGERTGGSEQSTDNTAPYPGEGDSSADGEKDMQKMDGTVNQWNETDGMPPLGGSPPQQGGMPPQQPQAPPAQMAAPPVPMGGPPGGNPCMAELPPHLAQQYASKMPALGPMTTTEILETIQGAINKTLNDYHKQVSTPINERLNNTIRQQRETLAQQKTILTQQREAIKALSHEIQETKAASGNLKFDLDHMKKNATATFRDFPTTPLTETRQFLDDGMMPLVQPVNHKSQSLSDARAEIDAMDKLLKSGDKSFYR